MGIENFLDGEELSEAFFNECETLEERIQLFEKELKKVFRNNVKDEKLADSMWDYYKALVNKNVLSPTQAFYITLSTAVDGLNLPSDIHQEMNDEILEGYKKQVIKNKKTLSELNKRSGKD